MKEITVSQPQNDSFIAQLVSLYEIFKETSNKEKLSFDLSKLKWICPILISPISAYINSTQSQADINNCAIKSYLDIINFPQGIDSVSKMQQIIQSSKSYIPISVLKKENNIERERLESMFALLVYKNLDTQISGIKNALYYPITELVTNIFEHSKKDIGYIFGQFYPNKDYLDICIVDQGRGLQASYKEDRNLEFSDEDAINKVMEGYSTKLDKERGYGVWTSKRVVCDGLKGDFMLISGSAALISSKNSDKLFSLPDFCWQGVIVAYRIPAPEKSFDISQYLE